MLDYKEMYQIMVSETEKAVNTLIAAQRKCEEMVMDADDPELVLMERKALPPNGEG